jgi:hypothetical protein
VNGVTVATADRPADDCAESFLFVNLYLVS